MLPGNDSETWGGGVASHFVDSDLWLHLATWEAYEWMWAMGDVLFKWLLFTSGLVPVLLAMLSVLSDHGYCVHFEGLLASVWGLNICCFCQSKSIKSNTVSISKSEASPDLCFLVMEAGSTTSLTLVLPKKNEDTERVTDVIVCEFLHVD